MSCFLKVCRQSFIFLLLPAFVINGHPHIRLYIQLCLIKSTVSRKTILPLGHTSGFFPAGISTLLFMHWKIRSNDDDEDNDDCGGVNNNNNNYYYW